MENNQTLEELQNRVMRHFTIDASGNLKDKDQAALKEQLKNIKLTPISESELEKLSTDYVYVSPFAYELDGSYQAITEHPEVVTYSTSSDGHTSEKNKSVDYSTYILKPYHRPAEAINRLGYFEALMKKYKIKDIAELELMIEAYIDERGE